MAVKDLKVGMSIADTFLVSDVRHATTQKGSPYISCKFNDRTGSISAMIWDFGTTPSHSLVKDGALVHVGGAVTDYKGNLQLSVQSLGAPQTTDMRLFEKRTEYDIADLQRTVRFMTALIESEPIRDVAWTFINGPLFEEFSKAPAATGMHHAFIGGLLEHTAEMLETARALFELPCYRNKLNKDLVYFGILFHDFGKIFEYRTDAGFKKKIGGVLVGHIPKMGALIYKVCHDLGVPEMLTDSLMHVVLAHHKFVKWGSPNAPAFPEALFVHHVDNLHGDVMGVLQKIETDLTENETVKHGFGDESCTIIKKRFSVILEEAEEEYALRRESATICDSQEEPSGQQDHLGGF